MTEQRPISTVMPMSQPGDYYDLSRIRPEVLKVLNRVNEIGPRFAERARGVDDDASFPVENHKDLADEGFLGLLIPQEFGGWGFSMGEYAMVGAEIGKYCGATALTFNMHNGSMAWSRYMYDMPNLTPEEKAKLEKLGWDKLMEEFKKRLAEQKAVSYTHLTLPTSDLV